MAIFPCLQISSGDDNTVDDHALYSSTIHKVIFTILTGLLIGLLQITPTNAEVTKYMVRGFLVFVLIYFILLVWEVKLRRSQALIHHLVGHFSHFFGSIAANMLVSLIFPIFALVVAILCLLWFFFVVYRSFVKYKVQQDLESGNANPSDQHFPQAGT